MKTAVSEAKERTVGDLLADIRQARRWLRPGSTARRVLGECEQVVIELVDKLEAARAELTHANALLDDLSEV